jgi:hypothetical protein
MKDIQYRILSGNIRELRDNNYKNKNGLPLETKKKFSTDMVPYHTVLSLREG